MAAARRRSIGYMISFNRISKQYGRQVLFVDASFQFNPGEKVGLVGPNGAGKTTLFRMIVGEETPDDGEVSLPRRLSIGYFRQDVEEMAGRTVLDEAIAGPTPTALTTWTRSWSASARCRRRTTHLEGYALEAQAREVLHGLGFDAERIDGGE